MRLSHKDFAALQRAILQLHDFHDVESFRRAVPGIFLRIVAADYLNASDFVPHPAGNRVKMVDCFESDGRVNAEVNEFTECHLLEHPISQYFIKGGVLGALKQTDFMTETQFRNSVWHANLRRYFDCDRMISLALGCGRGAASINIMRRGREFNERDRLMLNLLRPHYDQAYRNTKLMEDLMSRRTQPLASYRLSARETEVAGWLAEGKSNPEIAIILHVHVRTVEKHMERILEKLGVENRTTAAVVVTQCCQLANLMAQPSPYSDKGQMTRRDVRN